MADGIAKTLRDEIISHSPVKLVDEIILRGYSEKASDIHVEPTEFDCRVRIRIDGVLVHLGKYKKEIHDEAVARLKVLSSLRTDIRTLPQDGRFVVTINGSALNIRLSIIPSYYGQKCVLRLLPQTPHVHTLESLGFSCSSQEKIIGAISNSYGMVLVAGPTGSGKTTTLYTLLQKISQPGVSTVALEDPIEYSVPNVTQIPIQPAGGLTFSTALRSVVRQDPDVIMVGEIRDSTTAELSTQAALTGHLVLSTLHTNDAATALPRLTDMGVEPFLIASTVRAIISQRLVRKICQICKKEFDPTKSESDYLERQNQLAKYSTKKLVRGKGCEKCRGTGYSGRTVISEVLVLDDEIRGLIMQKVQAIKIRDRAVLSGMVLILEDAIEKVFQGVTTLEEIVSICHQ